ncbi:MULTISPECIES: PP2C family protein-serine/threonine phosphatase [unclassified Streptomyces]|uniref:PP2C family protein-serine/threonine phosphatase n=1 Tax=unclassified Streptomyces TaxID=2593676 RepID=UPI0029ABAE31|nr:MULTISPECIES: PP2C family protein-serine/threonine phosphatase [unclassified Streptomyces]MDX3771765.1 PP2C family protein-serine/threonine phosphatase [Streptomyces sp. AK08-01B]MDX3820824.1 PP2C family protein-serine/threonine phosphatase [Streptomyces sp. AK08-01A]
MVRLASLALIPAAVIVDLFTPNSWPFNRFLVGPPALAAACWSPAGTGAIGLAALVTDIAVTADKNSLGVPRAWLTMGMIALVTVVAMYASHVRELAERTMADLRSVAEAAQRALVRPLPSRLGPTRMAAMYLAAAAQARIGGDFYEAQRTPYGIRLMIGDVRGKGLPAVEAASVMMSAFREAVHDAPDLPALAARLEASIQRYSAQSGEVEERFATGLLAEFPEDGAVLRLLTCGHPPPLLLSGGTVRELEATAPSPPFNLAALLADGYHVDAVPFRAGDSLLLYTDGVSEARNSDGVFYPVADRMRPVATAAPRALIDHLGSDLLAYASDELNDDAAALVIHRTSDGTLTRER